jgi:hypothetical protein
MLCRWRTRRSVPHHSLHLSRLHRPHCCCIAALGLRWAWRWGLQWGLPSVWRSGQQHICLGHRQCNTCHLRSRCHWCISFPLCISRSQGLRNLPLFPIGPLSRSHTRWSARSLATQWALRSVRVLASLSGRMRVMASVLSRRTQHLRHLCTRYSRNRCPRRIFGCGYSVHS